MTERNRAEPSIIASYAFFAYFNGQVWTIGSNGAVTGTPSEVKRLTETTSRARKGGPSAPSAPTRGESLALDQA